MKKAELYILSGFLGSGKTTMLQQLLVEEKKTGRKVAVLMNELGRVSIDSNSVDEDIPLKELLDGCVCCTIQDKLESTLQSVLIKEQPDVIYLETTGAAHPVEAIDSILSPIFANRLQIKGILTVVDGKRWLERQKLSVQIQQLLLEQVRFANLLLVNRTDELSAEEQAKINGELQAINSHCFILLTNYSKFPYSLLTKLAPLQLDDTKKVNIAHLHLSSFVYTFTKTINANKFEDFLRELPDTIYRIKGYVQFNGSTYPDLFQYSYGMPLFMREEMKMPLNMVLIGENINWVEIESKLSAL